MLKKKITLIFVIMAGWISCEGKDVEEGQGIVSQEYKQTESKKWKTIAPSPRFIGLGMIFLVICGLIVTAHGRGVGRDYEKFITRMRARVNRVNKGMDTSLSSVYSISELLRAVEKPESERMKIVSLSLNNFKLTELPMEVEKLSELKYLDLRNNKLKGLGEIIGKLKKLEILMLDGNEIESLPEEYMEKLEKLSQLHLSKNGMKVIPDGVYKLHGLRKLDLTSNNIKSLSPDIGNLVNLNDLIITSNELETLPDTIGKLTNLTGLYVGNNRLSSLPVEIGKLTSLTGLYLENNQLSSLPMEIGNLRNLRYLFVSNNAIRVFPDSIGGLDKYDFLLDALHNPISKDGDSGTLGWQGLYKALPQSTVLASRSRIVA